MAADKEPMGGNTAGRQEGRGVGGRRGLSQNAYNTEITATQTEEETGLERRRLSMGAWPSPHLSWLQNQPVSDTPTGVQGNYALPSTFRGAWCALNAPPM